MNITEKLIISFGLTYKTFEDIMVTALEGGSNYWYDLQDLTPEFSNFAKLPDHVNEPLSVKISRFIWLGGELPIYDRESTDSKIGVINLEKVKDAFRIAAESIDGDECYGSQLGSILSGNYDKFDADTIFQLAVLGSVVFA